MATRTNGFVGDLMSAVRGHGAGVAASDPYVHKSILDYSLPCCKSSVSAAVILWFRGGRGGT